jgi:DNA-binding transcriptional regulator YiaG
MQLIPSVDVAEVRRRLKLSQAEFAAAFGLSLDSVKNWEQGHRSPEGPAKVLLAVIAKPSGGAKCTRGLSVRHQQLIPAIVAGNLRTTLR